MVRAGLVVLACLISFGGCRKVVPEAAPVAKGAPATLEILKGDRWLFTYAEPDGQFATTDKPEIVPPVSRGLVRVLDPSNPSAKNNGSNEVFVADLNQLLNAGKTQAKALSREAFETAALAQLPAGQSSALAEHAPGAGPPPSGAPPLPSPHGDGGLAPGTTPVVTVYGTSWCGACRAARQYLSERKIPFADKDVEQDPAAARELAQKAAKLGIPTDRVPVIEVRGRLLLGFDRARIETLLGEAT
ncbi:MAG TPA: glutaredoxin family protein [Polyangia bacterium]|nr:glutaredoxin family protein [Polyangia bacterium]